MIITKLSKGLIAILSVTCLAACSYQQVDIKPVDKITLHKIGARTISFELYLTINNPNRRSFTITSLDLGVAINRMNIGRITNEEPVKIERESEDTYPFSLDFQLDSWLKGVRVLADVVSAKKLEMTLEGETTIRSFLLHRKIPVH
jgi:LEA14-like dessication related protein